MIVTLAVVLTAAQLPEAAIVYVTVYAPAVLVLGVIAPVFASMVKPADDEYVPPGVLFTLRLTGCTPPSV